MNQEMSQEENKWDLLFVLLLDMVSLENVFLILFMFMIHTLQLLNKNYTLFYPIINWMFKIFVDKDMTVLVTCMENGTGYKQSSWKSVLMHIMFIVSPINYSWFLLLHLKR